MVASIIAYSLSGSSAKVFKKDSPKPRSRPTEKAECLRDIWARV
jgi:hypothetical protein